MIAIEEFKKKITKKSRLIGLDLGSKRIGIAICDDHQSIATPFKTIDRINTTHLIDELKEIIKENNIKGIVIGNPINMDGSLYVYAIPLSACFNLSLFNKFLNRSLSSAKSIDVYCVPKIGRLLSCKNFASLIGVCPPN